MPETSIPVRHINPTFPGFVFQRDQHPAIHRRQCIAALARQGRPLAGPGEPCERGAIGRGEGLILLGEYQPDFVILDLNIPKVDGFELIQSIHAKLGGTLYRYCVVTGLSEDDIRARGSLPEGCPVLTKPVDFARLEQLVAEAHNETRGGVDPAAD